MPGDLPCDVMAARDDVDVRRLRRSTFVAGVGDGIAAVALPLLAAGLTRDPLAVAGVAVAQHLPWALLAFALPVLRSTDRRTLAGAGGSLRALAVAVAGLLAVIGNETILTLQVVAFVLGLAQALDDDAGRVGDDHLRGRRGASVHGSLATAGLVGLGLFGLPLGGFLYEVLAPIPLLFDVGVFAIAALFALSLRRPLRRATETASDAPGMAPRLAAGTGVVTATAALGAAATGAVAGVLVLVALDDLGLGAPAFGLLLAGLGASSFVGAFVAPTLAGLVGTRAGTVASLLASGAALVASWYLLDPDRPLLGVLALGAAAAAAMAASVLVRSQLHAAAGQRVDSDALRGFHLAVWSATPVAALAGGVLARATDPAAVLLGAAGLAVIGAVVALGIHPHRPDETTPDATLPENALTARPARGPMPVASAAGAAPRPREV